MRLEGGKGTKWTNLTRLGETTGTTKVTNLGVAFSLRTDLGKEEKQKGKIRERDSRLVCVGGSFALVARAFVRRPICSCLSEERHSRDGCSPPGCCLFLVRGRGPTLVPGVTGSW